MSWMTAEEAVRILEALAVKASHTDREAKVYSRALEFLEERAHLACENAKAEFAQCFRDEVKP